MLPRKEWLKRSKKLETVLKCFMMKISKLFDLLIKIISTLYGPNVTQKRVTEKGWDHEKFFLGLHFQNFLIYSLKLFLLLQKCFKYGAHGPIPPRKEYNFFQKIFKRIFHNFLLIQKFLHYLLYRPNTTQKRVTEKEWNREWNSLVPPPRGIAI